MVKVLYIWTINFVFCKGVSMKNKEKLTVFPNLTYFICLIKSHVRSVDK